MKILLSWLREFVDWDLSTQDLCDRLTMAGFEVEAVENFSADFSKVVVGQVLEIRPHPNADRLTLCNVNIGKDILNIVCGAKNISPGDIVPVALDGAQLPGGKTITSAKVRGELSQGMLCSQTELGFSNDAKGIWLLPGDLALGKNVVEVLGLRDTGLVLNVTPNRPDALSIRGIAREVAALTGGSVRSPAKNFSEKDLPISEKIQVAVEAPQACPRYMARVIENVKVGPSPYWLKQRLERMGQRSVNNVVDVTNFVLLELGHPMHAFDFGRIQGGKISVRYAHEGEKILTLDGVERILNPAMLVISDERHAIALAGVMGGQDTQVHEATKTVLLECAYFQPKGIRGTSKVLGLSSESSYRFERGVDPMGLPEALDRAAFLVQQIAGGEILKGACDMISQKISPRQISFRPSHCQNLLGASLELSEMEHFFHKLKLDIQKKEGDSWTVAVPTYRPDLMYEVDLIEEVVRLWGYEKVPTSSPPVKFDLQAQPFSNQYILRSRAKSILQGLGLSEAITYSFLSQELLEKARGETLTAPVLMNPVRQDYSHMRTSLMPNLLSVLSFNEHHGCANVHYFEFGNCFFKPRIENPRVALAMMGKVGGPWREEAPIDFFYLKGNLSEFLTALGLKDFQFETSQNLTYHPGRQAQIRSVGETLGVLGEIHPDVLKNFDLRERVYGAELDFEILSKHVLARKFFTELPRFPSVVRDIALVVDEKISHDDLLRVIREGASSLLEEIRVFDVYQGPQVPEGKKSLAFSLCFRSLEGTLRDEDVEKIQSKIKARLVEKCGCQLR